MSAMPVQPRETPSMVVAIDKAAKSFGMTLRLVRSDDVRSILAGVSETATLSFESLAEAKSQAA
jgi:hypothetical protein